MPSAAHGGDPFADLPPPIIIGATGGSGTRAVRQLLVDAGGAFGTDTNEAGDALAFETFLDAWINPVMAETGGPDFRLSTLSEPVREGGLAALEAALTGYREEIPEGAALWGWKNPRSMYLLPFLAERFPGLRFVHLIRDGRDMAFSANQLQAIKHSFPLFGPPRRPREPAQTGIRLWALANSQVAAWGARTLGPRYLPVRYEDLCDHPDRTLPRLLAALEAPTPTGTALEAGFRPAPTIGRWRLQAPARIRALEATAGEALDHFGYGAIRRPYPAIGDAGPAFPDEPESVALLTPPPASAGEPALPGPPAAWQAITRRLPELGAPAWDRVRPGGPDWLTTPGIQAALAEAAAVSAPSGLFGFAEAGRQLPFWLRVAERLEQPLGVVLAIPHPESWAKAWAEWQSVSLEDGAALWLAYVLDAEARSRGLWRVVQPRSNAAHTPLGQLSPLPRDPTPADAEGDPHRATDPEADWMALARRAHIWFEAAQAGEADGLEWALDRIRQQADQLPVPKPAPTEETAEAQAARLEAEIAALRASTSWRLTRPLRVVKRRLFE